MFSQKYFIAFSACECVLLLRCDKCECVCRERESHLLHKLLLTFAYTRTLSYHRSSQNERIEFVTLETNVCEREWDRMREQKKEKVRNGSWEETAATALAMPCQWRQSTLVTLNFLCSEVAFSFITVFIYSILLRLLAGVRYLCWCFRFLFYPISLVYAVVCSTAAYHVSERCFVLCVCQPMSYPKSSKTTF